MPEILGTHYKIRFEFEEGQFTYFCPTALKYLLHVGMSTLQLLAGNGDILSIPSRTTEIRETKIDQCSTWIRVLLFQLCIKDESNPTYFRCDYFASETEAAQFYLKYLMGHLSARRITLDLFTFYFPRFFGARMSEFAMG
jgi:hypothetical protein